MQTRNIPVDQYIVAAHIPTPIPPKVTIWTLIGGSLNDLKELVSTSSIAGFVVPALFIGVGGFILWQQVSPEIDQQLRQSAGYYDQGTVPLVAGEYVTERTKYLSDPGAGYFQELTQSALKQHILQTDPVSNNYNGTFYLTIPALGMNRLPVQSNVESGVSEAYNSVLKNKLAHFKSTGLPISDVQNNIVVYGHSARANYKATPDDPAGAFTFLSDLKIGDEITLEVEGKSYKYVMTRSKIVEPNDTSIITGTSSRQTLTLFTCYPRGNNSHRYVAIAKPV
jgi:LPXTG-site transpeptidase (sortase) family protein